MGDEHGIDLLDFFAQALEAELRRRIHNHAGRRRLNVDGRAGAVVFRIGQEGLRVINANHRHALRGAGAEESEGEGHGGNSKLKAQSSRIQGNLTTGRVGCREPSRDWSFELEPSLEL